MGVTVAIGAMRQSGTVSSPDTPVPNSDGIYTQTYTLLDPPVWRFAIETASVQATTRNFSDTVTAHASYIFTGRYHPDIQVLTRIVWSDRSGASHTATVLDVTDTEGAGVETKVLVTEVVL